jgi:hypothetical protein
VWPDCPFTKFVGLTTPTDGPIYGFKPLAARAEKGWRQELLDQVAQLPPHYTHVLLLLDDFLLLKRPNNAVLVNICGSAVAADLSYVRLKPLDRGYLGRAVRRISSLGQLRILRIPEDEPYVAALQAVVWERAYLMELLALPGSIWEFEHTKGDVPHFCISDALLEYRHLVEKGAWRGYARGLLAKVGASFDPGSRRLRPASDRSAFVVEKIKFGILGFSVVRVKRFLGKWPTK